jgi:hypothetical protein
VQTRASFRTFSEKEHRTTQGLKKNLSALFALIMGGGGGLGARTIGIALLHVALLREFKFEFLNGKICLAHPSSLLISRERGLAFATFGFVCC